jgi:hypothetical protein
VFSRSLEAKESGTVIDRDVVSWDFNYSHVETGILEKLDSEALQGRVCNLPFPFFPSLSIGLNKRRQC